MFKSFREASKENYGRTLPPGTSMPDEGLKIGALLRIADATEKMAQGYDQLIRDRNYQRERKEALDRENSRLRRKVAAYKGMLKKALS